METLLTTTRTLRGALFLALFVGACAGAHAQFERALASQAMAFMENRGQWAGAGAERVLYRAQLPGVDVLLMPNEIRYMHSKRIGSETCVNGYKIVFEGSSNATITEGYERLRATTNYYHHASLSNTAPMRAGSFRVVKYVGLYAGIDLEVAVREEGDSVRLKYEFILSPGANPSQIQMRYEGVDLLEMLGSGALSIQFQGNRIVDAAPVSFQDDNSISTCYTVKGNTVGFTLGDYDLGQELVIDPYLTWATYFAGSIHSIRADTNGYKWVLGEYFDGVIDLPTPSNYFDTIPAASGGANFLALFDRQDSLVFTTYIDDSSTATLITQAVASVSLHQFDNGASGHNFYGPAGVIGRTGITSNFLSVAPNGNVAALFRAVAGTVTIPDYADSTYSTYVIFFDTLGNFLADEFYLDYHPLGIDYGDGGFGALMFLPTQYGFLYDHPPHPCAYNVDGCEYESYANVAHFEEDGTVVDFTCAMLPRDHVGFSIDYLGYNDYWLCGYRSFAMTVTYGLQEEVCVEIDSTYRLNNEIESDDGFVCHVQEDTVVYYGLFDAGQSEAVLFIKVINDSTVVVGGVSDTTYLPHTYQSFSMPATSNYYFYLASFEILSNDSSQPILARYIGLNTIMTDMCLENGVLFCSGYHNGLSFEPSTPPLEGGYFVPFDLCDGGCGYLLREDPLTFNNKYSTVLSLGNTYEIETDTFYASSSICYSVCFSDEAIYLAASGGLLCSPPNPEPLGLANTSITAYYEDTQSYTAWGQLVGGAVLLKLDQCELCLTTCGNNSPFLNYPPSIPPPTDCDCEALNCDPDEFDNECPGCAP